MLGYNYSSVAVMAPRRVSSKIDVEQSLPIEFYFDSSGREINDIDLLSRSENNPELQKKLSDIVVQRDIQMSTKDESEIIKELDSEFSSSQAALDAIDKRLSELD